MSGIRCFLAVPVDSQVREAVSALRSGIQSSASAIRWENPAKLHMTLKFLGSIDPGRIELLVKEISAIARYHSSFDIIYEGLGAFPSMDRPRVLWVGVRDSRSILELQNDVNRAAVSAGFAEDERPFHPHLTIARIKHFDAGHRLTAILKSLTFEPVSTRCAEVLVMKSDLHPNGSRYTVLQSIPLSS